MKLNNKNKILLIGFFISIYFCYIFAISKTLFYINQFNSYQHIINSGTNIKNLYQLMYKEKQIDKWILVNNTSSINFQNDLLKNLTQYSDLYHLKITDFQEPHSANEKDYITLSYSFSLEGSFNGVLLLLNRIDNNQKLGLIKHVYSIKKTNYKTNQDFLVTTVIIQKAENLK